MEAIENSCDCCANSWNEDAPRNEICHCWHQNHLLRDCRYVDCAKLEEEIENSCDYGENIGNGSNMNDIIDYEGWCNAMCKENEGCNKCKCPGEGCEENEGCALCNFGYCSAETFKSFMM